MKFRFTIGKKIGTGFGVLLVLTTIVFMLTKRTLDSSRTINDDLIHVHSPSVNALQELKILVVKSKMLITNWGYFQSPPENGDKQHLIKMTDDEYPEVKTRILDLASNWTEREAELLDDVYAEIDGLFDLHDLIKSQLVSFQSYEDPEIRFFANIMIEEGGDIDVQTDKVLLYLDDLISLQQENANSGTEKMNQAFKDLENVVIYLGIALIIGGILIAFFTGRTIVNPIQKLKKMLLLMGKGITPEQKMPDRSDEIGEMGHALNDLIDGSKRTADFAKEVGSGNFSSEYQPLSEQDALGHQLLVMRKDLHELTNNLEVKVQEKTEEVVRQKEEIEYQMQEIEDLYGQVTDSIKYAQRIQMAILPPDNYVREVLPNSFVLYKPKDIVSGDFYWVETKNNQVIFAALDCTGHGVPGAFMTIIGHNQLNRALSESDNSHPAHILDKLNLGLSEALHTAKGDGTTTVVKDGMDAAMCSIDFDSKIIEFAGAYNPFYLIRDGAIQQIKGDKFPVGDFEGEQQFTNHSIQLQTGDTVYIFSDGYADQFGGPKGKKFMYKSFRNLLLEIQDLKMTEQKEMLDSRIEEWKGDLEQVDDILLIGLRIE